ncbi:MAG: hypothetical protein KAT90_04020 [Gammaproteobacteria bacterium]|nr:hypothetical protein [Gammaproteobacteria bacterium]
MVPKYLLEMTVISASDTMLTMAATTKMRIKLRDKVTAIPMIGNRINITIAVTSAVISIALSISNAWVRGLVTSRPLMIIRIAI